MKKDVSSKIITDIEDTLEFKNYNEKEKLIVKKILDRHPMQIPAYYYNLIDWVQLEDPIKRMALPSLEEINSLGEDDTSGEASNTKLPGVQHKYQETVLVLSTNKCFMYCRYCFRKRMVGYSDSEIAKRLEDTIKYVSEHKEVNNVLITGGDAFTMSNEMIENYVRNLSEIKHLDFIRFGTRSLVVFPERIYKDKKLLEILSKYNKLKDIVIVTHFNHALEITEEATLAAQALKKAGLSIRNQAVLLKGINDSPEKLANLLDKLTAIGIHPYYVFQCRPVKGATHFQVPLVRGIEMVDGARKRLDGLSKGFRYIMSHKRGKIEVFGKTDKEFIFKFHQSKFEEDNNKIFMKPLDEAARWLDIDLNLV